MACAESSSRSEKKLAETWEQHFKINPHCRQARTAHAREWFSDKPEYLPMEAFPSLLTTGSPSMPYVRRHPRDRSTLHWGQLKLYVSELTLLTNYTTACSGTRYTVLYAGAAPGNHIAALAALFPRCTFHLYDPLPFCAELCDNPPPNVTVYPGTRFTEGLAEELAERHRDGRVVLISDIRTGKAEEFVAADMAQQESWVRTLTAEVSMVKFRLPWSDGATTYLAGEILLPAFAPCTSTECRLVTTAAQATTTQEYNNRDYEEACAYHNTVGRAQAYAHMVTAQGLDRCYDCTALVRTVRRYLSCVAPEGCLVTDEQVSGHITELVAAIGEGRTLATAYSSSSNSIGGRHRTSRGRTGRARRARRAGRAGHAGQRGDSQQSVVRRA